MMERKLNSRIKVGEISMNQTLVNQTTIDVRECSAWMRSAGTIALKQMDCLEKQYDNNSIVTSADLKIEEFITQKIHASFPNHNVLSEGRSWDYKVGEDVWILDPIDGTRAFATGLPFWGISLAFFKNKQPVFGMFYMPAVNELYVGVDGKAFLNDKQLATVTAKVKDDPSTFLAVPSKVFHDYEINFPRIRSFGSLATHLAYVSRGIAIGTLTRRFYLWDIAGILPVLVATGIDILPLDGSHFSLDGLFKGAPAANECLVCHPDNYKRLRETIRPRNHI